MWTQHDRQHINHLARLRAVKPSIDNQPPRTCKMKHMRRNLKKEKLAADRQHEIERDNKILVTRMMAIVETAGQSDGAAQRRAAQ